MVREKCGIPMPRERLVSLVLLCSGASQDGPPGKNEPLLFVPTATRNAPVFIFIFIFISLHNASTTGRKHPFLQCTIPARAPHTL